MISGSAIKHFLQIVLFFCFSVLAAQADELGNLMQDMAAVKHRVVQYKEEKLIDLLEAPISSEGTLEYIAPDKLVRNVHKPFRVRYIIGNKQITIEKVNKSQTRDLDEVPMVRTFIESFRAVLAGDLIILQKHYVVEFNGDRKRWEIILRPKNKKLSGYVNKIHLSGAGDMLLLYIVEDSNGDLTRMQLFPVDASEAEMGD